MATVDCTHPRAGHQHGTYLAYQKDGCRCGACRKAYRIASKWQQYRTLTGTHSYVDAGRARAHVLALLEVLTVSQIEQRSGVHRTAIRVLIGDYPGKPASKRISCFTQEALLGVRAYRVGPEISGLVDRTGTQRRLRALIALGWPAKYLAKRLGCSSATIPKLTADTGSPVLASTRAKVAALYEELSMTTPPPSRYATRARGIARRRGWLPPLVWDDIDDPDEVVDQHKEGPRSMDVLVEDFNDTYWSHQGMIPAAARRLGCTEGYLSRRLYYAVAEGYHVKPVHRESEGRCA